MVLKVGLDEIQSLELIRVLCWVRLAKDESGKSDER